MSNSNTERECGDNVLSKLIEKISNNNDGGLCIEESGQKEQLEKLRDVLMQNWGNHFTIQISQPNADGQSKLSLRHNEPIDDDTNITV